MSSQTDPLDLPDACTATETSETDKMPLRPASVSSSEEDDESDEDDYDDDDEPMLKYQRLSGTLSETLKKDAVSAMDVSDRFLAIGTHWGVVHILDVGGNNVKRFECHSASVNCVCIDTSAEFVASASDDGKVVVNSLYTNETALFRHRRPVKAVALESEYAKKPSKTLVSGGTAEELLLTGKGWFSSFDTVIASGEGPIWAIVWRKDTIAWANDAGVKLYDVTTQTKFAYIDRPHGSPRADLFRCNLCWKDDETLMIGWADSVKIGVIKDRKSAAAEGVSAPNISSLPPRYVEIMCEFRTDFIVSGIAPLLDQIVLLSFIVDMDGLRNIDVLPSSSDEATVSKRVVSQQPEVHVVDMHGEHIANDVLNVFGYEHYRANDYHLAHLTSPSDTTFYLVSPKDIITAKPRNTDDRIKWLTDKARYEEALRLAELVLASRKEADGSAYEGVLKDADIVAIGIKYLGSLCEEGNYEKAATQAPKILRNDAKLWEEWVFVFLGANRLSFILPFIPYQGDTRLNKSCYEMVLSRFLETDKETFSDLIKKWPTDLYNAVIVTDAVEYLLTKDPENMHLLDAGIDLSVATSRFEKALLYGLKLHRPGILTLVEPHNLFHTLQTHVHLVVAYDMHVAERDEEADPAARLWTGGAAFGVMEGSVATDLGEYVRVSRRAGCGEGVRLLVENADRAPVSSIVKQLSQTRRSLHIYLDALFRASPQEGVQFHSSQVELYADFDPTRLLEFLRSSALYKVQDAFSLCEVRDLVPEMVYLLGKMGDKRKALLLVIERLGDVNQAIDFAKEQNDEVLWDDLIRYSVDKPPFIIGLLENLGSHIDPVKIIRQIPEGLPIPQLRANLIKIMTDYGIQMSLREGCRKILVSDAVALMEALYLSQRRAAFFSEEDLKCSLCESRFSFDDPEKHIVIYFCRHLYHKSCLLSKSIALKRSVPPSPGLAPTLDLSSSARLEESITPEMECTIHQIYSAPTAGTSVLTGALSPTRASSVGIALDRVGGMVGIISVDLPSESEEGQENVPTLQKLIGLRESARNVGLALDGVDAVSCPICRA
ncbi:hypothetical protein BC830DRAFT_1107192 [Chytriomyces sp. MP71]|nr:hypothetical protein BC830DRAFT_1107192 [Chytriomyces sp. MP71]